MSPMNDTTNQRQDNESDDTWLTDWLTSCHQSVPPSCHWLLSCITGLRPNLHSSVHHWWGQRKTLKMKWCFSYFTSQTSSHSITIMVLFLNVHPSDADLEKCKNKWIRDNYSPGISDDQTPTILKKIIWSYFYVSHISWSCEFIRWFPDLHSNYFAMTTLQITNKC